MKTWLSLFKAYFDQYFIPVNPLLVASAIATSLVQGTDYQSFLQQFVAGDDVPGLEKALLVLFDGRDYNWFDHSLLLEELPVENAFVDALVSEGINFLIQTGPHVSTLPDDDGHSHVLDSRHYPSYLQAYWAAWLVVNPIFSLNPFSEENPDDPVLGAYGFHRNSIVHNVRELYENRDSFLDDQINQFLADQKRNQTGILMDIYMEMKSNSSLLLERMHRFYLWLPHEISAYLAELDSMDPEGRKKEYPHFLLPETSPLLKLWKTQ
jgi:hypothetical protein